MPLTAHRAPLQKNGPAGSGIGRVLRPLAVAWCAALICLMALGTFSTERIGAMTWGVEHDVWSAAIALSQMNFGLSGERGYKEIEAAIAHDVTATGSVWEKFDAASQSRPGDPAAVTRGLQRGAAVKMSDIAVPKNDDGYLTDYCEDIGYADFYNVAFRLFGVSAFSTHWLYYAILGLSFCLFVALFFREDMAIASLTLLVSALFLEESSALFSESLPSLAANRGLSTLALLPLLHVLCTAMRRRPLGWPEIGLLVCQTLLMAFVLAARASGNWCLVAIFLSVVVIALRRALTVQRDEPAGSLGAIARRLVRIPHGGRLAGTAVIVAALTLGVGIWRNMHFSELYFRADNLPHHLVWHSAFIALALNPDWHEQKPYADLPDGGDGAGFRMFEHGMQERGKPFASARNFYFARKYERFIRGKYIKFLVQHPLYGLKLFAYYKPDRYYSLMVSLVGSVSAAALAFSAISLLIAATLLSPATLFGSEVAIGVGLVWLCSLIPVFWAYPATWVIADQLWASLFVLLMLIAALVRLIGNACLSVFGHRSPKQNNRLTGAPAPAAAPSQRYGLVAD